MINVVSAERMAGVLRALERHTGVEGLSCAGEPQALSGGYWAELVSFRLVDPPSGWPAALVARVMPDAATAAKETVIQGTVSTQGYGTPAVLAAGGPDDGIDGRAWLVMPLADGRPLLHGLDGVAVLRKLPSLARQLPELLARAAAGLHRLDVAPVRDGLVAAGVPVPSTSSMLENLRGASSALGRDDLVGIADRLDAARPEGGAEVICHGDLHPFNILVGADGAWTVLDWSAAVVAPRELDLGFTSLLLSHPPLVGPAPLGPVVRAAGRALARRFLRSYETRTGLAVDETSLRWHQHLVALRALVEVAGWSADGSIDARAGHPWLIAGAAFAERLSAFAGSPVRAR